MVKGIGPARVRRLLDHFGDLALAWQATPDDLRAAGLDRRSAEALLAARQGIDLDLVLQRLEQVGVTVLTWESPDYPVNLLNIAQPPPVLYVRGQLTSADEWAVALVGTRQASAYGRDVAHELAAALAAMTMFLLFGRTMTASALTRPIASAMSLVDGFIV